MKSSISQSLERLLVRARQNSQSALGRLMVLHRSWLRGLATQGLPPNVRRKVDASDLVQEVQYRAALDISKFRGHSIGEFRGWLAGILANVRLQLLRFWGVSGRDLKREEPPSPAWSERGELADPSMPIPDRLAHEEECVRLSLAKSWCSEPDRTVIDMHLTEGRSHEEIADELGITPAAVRQRYCRAVRRVGEAMQLLELMTRRGLDTIQQDVIGLHRFQGADPAEIAGRLQLPEELVARWIAEARPFFRKIAKDAS